MRRSRRNSGAAIAALFLGAGPLLATIPAYATPAYPTPEAGSVSFSGGQGSLGLSCTSTPSAAALRVQPGATIRFTNNMDEAATLEVSHQASRSVQAGGTTSVRFDSGSSSVRMVPRCGPLALDRSIGTVTVEVAPVRPVQRPPTNPDPAPNPAPPPVVEPPSDGVPSDAPSTPADPATASPAPPLANPDDLGADGLLPAPDDEVGALEPGLTDVGDPAAQAEGGAMAIEPALPVSSVPGRGFSGLLALVATICVAGVSVAAIRAILSQRASRMGAA